MKKLSLLWQMNSVTQLELGASGLGEMQCLPRVVCSEGRDLICKWAVNHRNGGLTMHYCPVDLISTPLHACLYISRYLDQKSYTLTQKNLDNWPPSPLNGETSICRRNTDELSALSNSENHN